MENIQADIPEIPSARSDDIHNHEHMNDADLVLFMAGNQFMVMDELLDAFRSRYPGIRKIFYETLPPGLELKQILAGGARFRGEMIDVVPDVYTSVTADAMRELTLRGYVKEYHVYLHNRIVLMVPEGNPLGIRSVGDLGQDSIRISQPGAMEDISKYIAHMYEQAGGHDLVVKILETKRAEGTTILTVVHHRETPLRILKGTVDIGPVWATEVVNARKEGAGVEAVDPGEALDQRDSVNYYVAKIIKGKNLENADRFIEFMRSERAKEIYRSYGFVPS